MEVTITRNIQYSTVFPIISIPALDPWHTSIQPIGNGCHHYQSWNNKLTLNHCNGGMATWPPNALSENTVLINCPTAYPAWWHTKSSWTKQYIHAFCIPNTKLIQSDLPPISWWNKKHKAKDDYKLLTVTQEQQRKGSHIWIRYCQCDHY